MISSVPRWLLLIGTIVSATTDGTMGHLGFSHLRGNRNERLATPTLNTPATHRFLTVIEYRGSDVTTTDDTLVTISLQVFLPDTPRLLDDVTRFETAALSFISDNVVDDFPKGVRFTSASVIEQRLTGERDTARIGLEVHFQVDASVSTDICKTNLERFTQSLLNKRNDVFKSYLMNSSKKIVSNDKTKLIGFAAATMGLCGMIATIGFLAWKIRKNKPSDRKELKKSPSEINTKPTLESSESFADTDSYLDHSVTFPMSMQCREKKPEEWDDVSGPDDCSYDNGSFNASVVFCPSVEQRGNEAIALEDHTDSDSDDEYSDASGDFQSNPLSSESLQEFDMALRRAEF